MRWMKFRPRQVDHSRHHLRVAAEDHLHAEVVGHPHVVAYRLCRGAHLSEGLCHRRDFLWLNMFQCFFPHPHW